MARISIHSESAISTCKSAARYVLWFLVFLLILGGFAVVGIILFTDPANGQEFKMQLAPQVVVSDAQRIGYWRSRAIMMDSRLDLANLQLKGGSGHDWERVQNELAQRETAFLKATNAIESACPSGLDKPALQKDSIIKCLDSPAK